MNPGDYGDVFNSLQGQYQPQVDLINSQVADLPRQQQAVTDSLNQAKVNAFKDITNSANSKGVLFSGVPVDQQSTYVGTKYLPAVAQNKTSFQNTKNTLLGQINTLQSARQRQAQDSVSSYQKAQQEEAYRQAQLDLGYARLNSSNANAAASRAGKAAPALNENQLVGAIRQGLNGVKGTDQKVSPQDFAQAYHTYAAAGYNPSNFYKYFQGYMNPNNKYYDYAIKSYKG